MPRCRLCTSNDDQALIEYLAEKLWDSRMGEFEIATPWTEAGAFWQSKMREMAVSAKLALMD
ncbi:MAG: hypothetical protein IIZ30_11305 [Sphingomonas sp.]|uniref:hypothetical protein n=1 Tax=Sphingomonas sp. TaxID=28214 RepID=UPI00257EB51D|nr:hypothetical protein [Sphingomonas sp.]MBQ1480613.1 hypothetical protein [Sphingomonas sp.]